MESVNLKPGGDPPKKPNKPSRKVSQTGDLKHKRRKRGKGTTFTHYKLGTKRGRQRKSDKCISEDDQYEAPDCEDGQNMLPSELSSVPTNIPPAEQTPLVFGHSSMATSSLFSTPQKVRDIPGPSTSHGSSNSSIVCETAQDRTRQFKKGDNPLIPNPIEEVLEVPDSSPMREVSSSTHETGQGSSRQTEKGDSPSHSKEIVNSSILQTPTRCEVLPGAVHTPPLITEKNPVQETCVVSAELVNKTTAELGRRIHMPFLILPEDNGINVLLLSRNKERTVQRRAFFPFDGSTEEVTVHTKALSTTILEEILKKDVNNVSLTENTQVLFIERVVTVVRRLRHYEVCVGVDDPQFKPLWEMEKDAHIDNNPYMEARYTVTLRPPSCHLLVSTERYTKRHCSSCIHTRTRFKANLPHHLSSESAPNTPNIHLHRSQLLEKLKKQKNKLAYARKQIVQLKQKVDEKIEVEGVDIDDDLNNDLCSIVDDAKFSPIQALFFEQQLKAVSVKDARRRRWHPTLIRFALLLKSTSTAAYRAIQDSSVIVLPSEKTLYEYSHATEPEEGCTVGKLNRICKQIFEKYPEAYQKYHILMMDEMHINKKLVYLKSTGEMLGYVSLSDAANEMNLLESELKGEKPSECPTIVTKIQAYMIKGVATSVSEVVGSFATSDAFDAEELHDLTWGIISALEKSGLKVIAIISDGCAVNRAFYNLHIPLTPSSVVFDTVNLCAPERPLFFFSDTHHLLKTIRNCFYRSGSGPKYSKLLTINGQVITWQTIVRLYKEDQGKTLRRCVKLNANNVRLNSYSVMKVNLAAQVMSATVALDIESRKWPGTSETVKFIRLVNDFFDMLNGTSSNQGTRQANANLEPYRDENDKRFDKLLDFVEYFKGWEDEVMKKTNFTTEERNKMLLTKPTREGIEMTVNSFIGATKFLLSEGVKFINARVFCQDPLERYFGKQRQSGGGSRNPTAAQFFGNEVNISIHRDMNVRMGNVLSEKRGTTVSNEPLPKRLRTN